MRIISQYNHWIFFICIGAFSICCILGETSINVFSFLAFAICLIEIVLCNLEYNFYFSLFLIPNLRILDCTGITVLVNICIVLPLIKYIFFYRLRKDVVIFAMVFFLIEFLHIAVLDNWISLLPFLCWIMSFIYALSTILNNNLEISRKKIGYALAIGIIFSAGIFLICNIDYTSNIMRAIFMGKRLAGYAGDPNYYSLYICLAMSLILTVREYSRWLLILIFCLVFIGFCTASKMCFITMNFIILYAITTQVFMKNKQGKLIRRIIVMIIISIMYLWKYVLQFLQNLFSRAGFDGLYSSSISMNRLTTNRSTLVYNYIGILSSNLPALLLGTGMSYHLYLDESSAHGSHNTYLDFILAWGFLGTILIIYACFYFFMIYRKKHRSIIDFKTILPILSLFINFLALSCFSATMFWFVLVAALSSFNNNLKTIGK